MREMAVGDYVLFYHSNADPPSIVGSAEVVKTAYPDDTQFDKRSDHYDPASTADRPRWEMVFALGGIVSGVTPPVRPLARR